MPWSRSTQAAPSLPEVESIEECTRLMNGEMVILFKHSPTCPVSWMAHREVMQLKADHPEAPLYLISVRRKRDVAKFIESETGIQHESPQIIVFRNGKPVADASHDEVTAVFIAEKAALSKVQA